MDTLKDKQVLEDIVEKGRKPWRIFVALQPLFRQVSAGRSV